MEDSAVTNAVPAVEEPKITSVATTRPGPVEPTDPNGSGRGDGSPWSLTHEKQVRNLKENWKIALTCTGEQMKFENNFETNPWFASIVTKLRVDPCLNSCELEIDQSLLKFVKGLRMSSLELAVLMGDRKMVQDILKRSSVPEQVMRGSPVDRKRTSVYFLLIISDTLPETDFLSTPLHLAVTGGDSHIVGMLLEKGANVNAQNFLDQTPLDFAYQLGNVPVLQQLLELDKEENKDPLHVAMRHGDVELMKKLPFRNVNAVDLHGKTPLHYLATRSFPTIGDLTNIVRYLAEDKALDMKALDSCKLSAFYVAVLCCNTKLGIALLDSFKEIFD